MTEAKPATDEEIDIDRLQASNTVRNLIARIDAEHAARLAAEARVKVLEKALRRLIEKATADAAEECDWGAELLRAVAVLDGTEPAND